jgi:hypothetical protein
VLSRGAELFDRFRALPLLHQSDAEALNRFGVDGLDRFISLD